METVGELFFYIAVKNITYRCSLLIRCYTNMFHQTFSHTFTFLAKIKPATEHCYHTLPETAFLCANKQLNTEEIVNEEKFRNHLIAYTYSRFREHKSSSRLNHSMWSEQYSPSYFNSLFNVDNSFDPLSESYQRKWR